MNAMELPVPPTAGCSGIRMTVCLVGSAPGSRIDVLERVSRDYNKTFDKWSPILIILLQIHTCA